jgi:predicted dehydrogenase
MNELRIGVIGAGGIMRQRHLPGLRQCEGVRITRICNSTRASAERFCAEHGLDAVIEDRWEAVCDSSEVDIVWVAAPPMLHAPASVRALDAGKHLFCQARMARHLGEVPAMLEAAARHPELVAALCPSPFGMKYGPWLVRQLHEGRLGALTHLRLTALSGMFADPATPLSWRQSREINGINLLNVGILAETLMHWLGTPTRLRSDTRIYTGERSGQRVVQPDSAIVVADWPGNVSGVLEFNGACAGRNVVRTELYGTQAALAYDMVSERVEWIGSPGAEAQDCSASVPEAEQGMWTVEKDFIRAVRDTEAPRPRPDFREGARYMAFTQAVVDSGAADGGWIHPAWPA